MGGDLRRHGQGRARRRPDQFSPGRPRSSLHRRECRGRRDHRAGRTRGRHRGGARRASLPCIAASSISAPSPCPAGYRDYEELLAPGQRARTASAVRSTDPWMLMYTSGTTGASQGRDPQPQGQCAGLARSPRSSSASTARTAHCWSCRCAMRIRSISSARSAIAAARRRSIRARASTRSIV